MALRNLTEGDCGQVNPLVQLASHALQDRTLRDNVGLPSTSGQWTQQYMVDNMMAPQTFRMDHLMREMQEIESQRALVPPVPASAVKEHLWANEYHNEIVQNNIQSNPDAIWSDVNAPRQQFSNRPFRSQGLRGLPNYMIQRPPFASHSSYFQPQHFQPPPEVEQPFETTKDKLDELDRELEKERLEEETQKQQGTRDDDEFEYNPEQWTSENTGLDADTLNSFSDIWTNMQKSLEAVSGSDAVRDSQSELDMDYSFTEDVFNDYKYVENNPMSEISDPLQKGKELLAKGDIPGAVLCFEAAVKQDETCVEAWKLLGTTWAENEQDPKAIYALKRGLSLEPDNLDILMALSVCYTNENYNYQACSMLLAWLMHHPEYKDIIPANYELKDQHITLLDDNIHKDVQNMLIKAAQRRPINPDYQVQCALGVLFNLNCEYDKAVDCFKSALQVRPQDSRLWNRLGATLANGNKPEEAIDAYHRALNLDPGFVRSRYNVGITCMNMNAYKEAAEHFLITLNQQARGHSDVISTNYTSDTIWSTFRLCTSLMGRYDLRAAMTDRNLEKLNKEFGMTEF